MDSIFTKIINRQIPAQLLFEDDRCIVFKDIQPQAPVHLLVVPKKQIARMAQATAEDEPILGHLLIIAAQQAMEQGIATSGYRLVINNGPDAGESVPHLHVHVLGGRHLAWPPG